MASYSSSRWEGTKYADSKSTQTWICGWRSDPVLPVPTRRSNQEECYSLMTYWHALPHTHNSKGASSISLTTETKSLSQTEILNDSLKICSNGCLFYNTHRLTGISYVHRIWGLAVLPFSGEWISLHRQVCATNGNKTRDLWPTHR